MKGKQQELQYHEQVGTNLAGNFNIASKRTEVRFGQNVSVEMYHLRFTVPVEQPHTPPGQSTHVRPSNETCCVDKHDEHVISTAPRGSRTVVLVCRAEKKMIEIRAHMCAALQATEYLRAHGRTLERLMVELESRDGDEYTTMELVSHSHLSPLAATCVGP